MQLHPGLFHFPGYLSIEEQVALAARCRDLAAAPPGPYVPTVRGGRKMSISMLCLGRHWNALTYKYESVRSDHDGRLAPPLPDDFSALARRIAAEAGMRIDPDICILNFYPVEGRLGLHQDKEESPETLAAGVPVVSVSLGDTARFVIGGLRRRDPVESILLESGDALVMGGASRLRFHGVARILPATGPITVAIRGRINLTFRQY